MGFFDAAKSFFSGSGAVSGALKRTEEGRIVSPDARFDAVITRVSVAGAASFVIEVHILPRDGKPVDGPEAVLTAERLTGIEIVWQGPARAAIRYRSGKIFQFTNFCEIACPPGARREIRLDLIRDGD